MPNELVQQDGVTAGHCPRRLSKGPGASHCDFVLSDVLDWKTDRKFDLVIAIGFWDYVADPLERLKVIRGISRNRFLSAWPRAGTLRAAVRKQRLKVSGCPVYFWRREQLDDYLRKAGFAV